VSEWPLWMDTKTAAAYVGSKSVKAFYTWRARKGLFCDSMGRVSRHDVDRVLRLPRKRRTMHPASLANLKQAS
jgi:hypothetical protein